MNEILSTIQSPTPQSLLLGKEATLVCHELITDLVTADQPVHIFDCGMRFNVFRIAEFSRLSEYHILHRIFIQRAFTPYQLLDSIADLILRHKEPEVHSKFYFFLNPTKQFFDGDVKQHDREYLLPILARQFLTLKDLGFRFVISESKQFDKPEFRLYLEGVKRSAVHYVLDCTRPLIASNNTFTSLFGTGS